MSRYNVMFESLAAQQQGAFIPFVTVADPDLETSKKIIQTLIDSGADALELGFPFSDPVADGPTIQAANIRALSHHVTTSDCLNLIAEIRLQNPTIPIGLLLYSNLVLARGIDNFYQDCAKAGVDSVLVADVPIRESAKFRAAAEHAKIDTVFIVPPVVNEDALLDIAESSQGYTYLLARAGVTGADTQANKPATVMIDKLKELGAAPAVLGFGISSPEQVKEAIQSGAAGAISGSATVKIIENYVDDKTTMLSQLRNFVTAMKHATQL